MSIFFENKKSFEVREAADKNALVILPIGILEQHGPHLPINTDNIIAGDIAALVAKRIKKDIPVMVLPTVWAGYHGKELEDYPGSVRVQQMSLYYYVYDICESLIRNGFKKIAMINGHGQNPAILQMVIREIANKHDVHIILTYAMNMISKPVGLEIKRSPEGGAGGHAGELETSLVLALREELVDMDAAPEGDRCMHRTRFFSGDMFPEHSTIGFGYYSTWEVQGTKSGVLGEPKYASKESGQAFIEEILKNYEELLKEYYEM